MGIRESGRLAIVAGPGQLGLARWITRSAATEGRRLCSLADIDGKRLRRAEERFCRKDGGKTASG
jgi:hypothetical protein